MKWHIVYTDRNGNTEVGRTHGKTRADAIRNAAWSFGVNQTKIKSAVSVGR